MPSPSLALKNAVPCPKCKGNLVQEVIMQFRAGPFKTTKLSCGHSYMDRATPITPRKLLTDFKWDDGRKALFDPFQIHTVQKTEEADLRFLNLNQMALGKMITTIATLLFHPEALPALVVCKARLTPQWWEHLVTMSYELVDGKKVPRLFPQVMNGGNGRPFTDIFNVGIVSFDSLWRIVNKSLAAKKEESKAVMEMVDQIDVEGVMAKLAELVKQSPFSGYKTIILDEFQMIKNPGASRTKGVRIVSANMKNIIGLSGTPTKNSAEEYYVPLNLVAPHIFSNFNQFCEEWVEYFTTVRGTSKALGIKPNKRDEFDKLIAPFSIRYTRKEAMPSLPDTFRTYEYIELADKIKEAYKRELKEFDEAYMMWETAETAREKFARWSMVNDSLMKLKRMVGTAKADWLVQPDGWLEDFLTQTDEKIVIAHHHIEAGLVLSTAISNICEKLELPAPIHLHGGISINAGYELIRKFKADPKLRVIIIRQLAEGEGFNLQECGHLVQVERQWNPANEEQVEDRLPRPGTTYEKVNVLYPVALGTVDELLAATVERKRYAAENTYGKGAKVHWIQTDILQTVAKLLKEKGLNPWKQAA